MAAMKKKGLKTFAFAGVGLTLFFALLGELYRFHGILLLDIWAPLFVLLYFCARALSLFNGFKILALKNFNEKLLPTSLRGQTLYSFFFLAFGFASLLLNSGDLENVDFYKAAFYGIRWAAMFSLYLICRIEIFEEQESAEKNPSVHGQNSKVFLSMITTFGALLSIAGFIQLYYVPNFTDFEIFGWDPHQGRLLSTWFDPNFVGGFLAFLLPISIGFLIELWQKLSLKKTLTAISLPAFLGGSITFMTAALFLTFSRSAYLAALAGILIFSFFRSLKIIVVSTLLAILLVSSSSQARERISSLAQSIASVSSGFFQESPSYTLPDPSARLRFTSWENAWELFQEKPLLGWGYNNYAQALLSEKKLKDTNVHSANGSDSSLLTILATSGLAGFIPYISIYIMLATSAFKKRRNAISLGFFAGLSGLFVHSIFVNSLLFPLIMAPFWIAAAASENE